MEKRKWKLILDAPEKADDYTKALMAIAERLEALVGIGDRMEEVGDLWANTLAFGGQPVGELAAQRWQCDKEDACTLMKGHDGKCVYLPAPLCLCGVPSLTSTGGICGKCGRMIDAPTP